MIRVHNEPFVKGFMRYWESYLNESTRNLAKLRRRDD